MNKLKVLVYEDEDDVAKLWCRALQDIDQGGNSKPISREEFEGLNVLINRRRVESRLGEENKAWSEEHEVDTADVVIIDYDLLKYSESADITGVRLAYLLRCYSRCGLIIILNEFGPNSFDLTLSRSFEDFADIHVGGDQIGNRGLWSMPFEGYRPWHWPMVPNARENFKNCVNDVMEHLDDAILPYFGLDEVIDWLPEKARHFLGPSIDERSPAGIENITFKDFAEHANGGLLPKDQVLTTEQTSRIAAARISMWLNMIIMPDQNVLVDAPHLVSRLPSLFRSANAGITEWQTLCDLSDSNVRDKFDEGLRKYEFEKSHWLWRPAWLWPLLSRDDDFEEVKNPFLYSHEDYDWVFCEDISKFVSIDNARSFTTDLTPPFIKRYVLDPNSSHGIEHFGSGGALDAAEVQYVPSASFSF